jgi:proline iminopeptidase
VYSLSTADGHHLYAEAIGTGPTPLLYLHGGPGSGCSVNQRKMFNPTTTTAYLIDQRGSGRSRPLAEAREHDLSTQTTANLVADLEVLRTTVGVDAWAVLGLSWGTTLALAYAEAHPGRVTRLGLGLPTTTSTHEVAWMTEVIEPVFPIEFAAFRAAVPEQHRRPRLVEAYASWLTSTEPAERLRAAQAWCAWEEAHVSLATGPQRNPRFADPDFAVRFATLVTHYWSNAAAFGHDELIANAARLTGIPGRIVVGRLDISSPLITATRLNEVWPEAELEIVNDAGHGSGRGFGEALGELITWLSQNP